MLRKPHGKRIRSLALFLLGVLIIQLAWQLTVPAFRGIDEIDHAHRATSVVRGQLGVSPEPVSDGRGFVVDVPRQMVADAESACRELSYVGRYNCYPLRQSPGGELVSVVSAAAQYSPAYYLVVGWPSLLLEGESAMYAMRAVSSFLCAALLGWAAAIAMRRGQPWLILGLLICLTPTVIYSSIVVAPNGLSIAGGALMWIAWLGPGLRTAHVRGTDVLAASVGCLVTVATHNTGFIWVGGCLVTMWILWTPHVPARARARTLRVPTIAALAALAAMTVWSLYSGANVPTGESDGDVSTASFAETLALPVLWAFQSIAAAPRAGGFASPLVYALWGATFFAVCAVGARLSNKATRRAMVLIALTITVLPLVFTWLTQDSFGLAWQGRYALPLGMGLVLLACYSTRDAGLALRARFSAVLLPLCLAATIASVSARTNLEAEGAEFLVASWVAPALTVLGSVALWLSLLSARSEATTPATSDDQDRDQAVAARDDSFLP